MPLIPISIRTQTDTSFPTPQVRWSTHTSSNVESLLSKLTPSKATGPDGIPSFILKKCLAVIPPSLAALFNLSCLGYHVSANLLNVPIASLMLLLVSLTPIKIWAWSLVTILSGTSILPTVHLRPTACWDSFLLPTSYWLELKDLLFFFKCKQGNFDVDISQYLTFSSQYASS